MWQFSLILDSYNCASCDNTPVYISEDNEEVLGDDQFTTMETTPSLEVTQLPMQENTRRPAPKRYNVVFMMADDMRAQLGCYQGPEKPLSKPKIWTPNLDQLASKSLLLKKAYIQLSLCGPSRTSILTGRRPDRTRIFDNRQYWRHFGGNFTTIPQYFRENGYRTIGIGKVFHRGMAASGDNDPISWSEPYVMPKHTEGRYLEGEGGWKPVTNQQQSKIPLMDTVAVDKAKQYLTELAPGAKSGREPFFLALGFKKPHSSYVCPKHFYDMYPLETEEQFLADMTWQTITLKKGRNLLNITIKDDGQAQIPHETLRHLRRGYFSCISYIDYLVGQVLKTLDDLQLTDSTIVSFVSDHGYHFGENGAFGKQSLHETATRVPMMIHIPGRTDSGIESNSIVEAIDLFPTLATAAGLPPMTSCPRDSASVPLCADGQSILSLINNPKQKLNEGALSQITATLGFMRYSIRTTNFRYSEWAKVQRDVRPNGVYRVVKMNPVGYWTELFDHRNDIMEIRNITDDPRYYNIKERLIDKLHALVLGSS